jgi:hypothetical protein
MGEWNGLVPGLELKEIATQGTVWKQCTVVRSEAVGLVFHVDRTVTDAGGDIDNVRSVVLVPWTSVHHVVVSEEQS